MSNKAKFILVGVGFLAIAGLIMLILAICLHWNIIGGLTHPIAIVVYAIVGIGLVTGMAILVKKKIQGR